MKDSTVHACLVAALRGVAGLTASELSDLTTALARLSVDELPRQVAGDCYDAAARARRRRDLRADHDRDLRALAARLAAHIQQLDTPGPTGRVLAAAERQRRRRESDPW